MNADVRPISLLIAALGGEGGGVLTDWLVAAAARCGFPAQSTSIPGVAQRTGATTYYIEIMPVPAAELGGRRPVMALMPGIGDVDLLLASELAEAARQIALGFVTPDRTHVVASLARGYLMPEKTAMADGRLDDARLVELVERHARASLVLDLEALAKEAGAMMNAVMLGVVAGTGMLPIPAEAYEAAIAQGGRAAEANLRGFRAGFAAAQQGRSQAPRPPEKRWRAGASSLAVLEDEAATLPETVRPIAIEGMRRLAHYQDADYAWDYIERVKRIAAVDKIAGLDGRLVRETARHLALRMSFEDVIRVAQIKSDPARLARIRTELGAQDGDPVRVVEYFKPGIDELCSILPPFLARPILALAERCGWLDRAYWGMHIKTHSVAGYLRLRALAALRPFRRRTHRFRAEQREIETWLVAVADAAALTPPLALEIAECANLVKGYGDTWKRGMANYRAIFEHVVRPALARRLPLAVAADAVANARAAALADPDGARLAATLVEIDKRIVLQAAE
ncbi:MAG: indolepyruvate oxidoreductase subunit beta family protein [Alphaproteobacteria bacterium]|nr:indolepyruvate oxidoreductase subunit beta family protein [Alphaproteobacteria bacterium]